MTMFYLVIRAMVAFLVRILFRIKTKGYENLPKEGGVVLCSNHTSLLDIPALVVTCHRQIYFMAKVELFKHRFMGWVFKNLGAFAVKRGSGGTDAINVAKDIVEQGKIMGIFPEGTRNPEGPPKRGKIGAALVAQGAGVPIIPVSIYHEGKFKIFSRVTIRYGKPISPFQLRMSDSSRAEVKRMTEVIMERITKQWEMGY